MLTKRGPRKAPRPPSPNTSLAVGCAKAARFHQPRMLCGPLLGFTPLIKSQLSCSKLALATAASLVVRHESGKPVRTTLMPPTCHPPNSVFTGPDQPPPHILPLPNGNSYSALFTKFNLASNA